MSDTSQGHGWWLASDGKWYPPEAWTGPSLQAAQVPYPAGSYAPQGPLWVPAPETNGLAIASFVCSCLGILPFLFGVPCILGVIFGFVSRGRIKRSHGALKGEGLAMAGIIVGFTLIGIFLLFVIVVVVFVHIQSCTGQSARFHCAVKR
jgi:hypothetical protein